MKLYNYVCSECGAEHEELFKSTEEVPEVLDMHCPECDFIGTLRKWNFKKNQHRVYIADSHGL